MNLRSPATARSEFSTQPVPLTKDKEDEKKKGKRKRKNRLWSLVTNVPELSILIMLIVGAYMLMGVFSKVESTEVLSASSIWLIIVGSFLISTAIATLAVIGGIGGGVIFTPIMLGFTSLDSLVIRATGLWWPCSAGWCPQGLLGNQTGRHKADLLLRCPHHRWRSRGECQCHLFTQRPG